MPRDRSNVNWDLFRTTQCLQSLINAPRSKSASAIRNKSHDDCFTWATLEAPPLDNNLICTLIGTSGSVVRYEPPRSSSPSLRGDDSLWTDGHEFFDLSASQKKAFTYEELLGKVVFCSGFA
jgi:hypothetical protein